MGLSLKKIVGKAGGAIGTLVGGLFGGSAGAAVGSQVGGALQQQFAPPAIIPDVGPIGGPFPMTEAAFPVMGAMSVALANAIAKLAARLGISLGSGSLSALTRTGTRVWQALTGFASRHPGLSLFSMLTALGLTAEEAASFIAWGSTRRRRRRSRGISARDLRTTRRTIRSVVSISASLRALTGGGFPRARRAFPRPIPPHRHISVK